MHGVLLDSHSTITHQAADAMLPLAETLPALQPPAPVVEHRETPQGAAEAPEPTGQPNPFRKMYFYIPDAFGLETSADIPVPTGAPAG